MAPDRDDDRARRGAESLTVAIKSRILDRVLAELRDDLGLRTEAHGYTKSDGSIYGKYEKADVDISTMLEVIDGRIRDILMEYEGESERPPANAPPHTELDK
jgi:hypothetical protein